MTTSWTAFASAAPGLVPWLHRELGAAGFSGATEVSGGVEVTVALPELLTLVRSTRIATRVLLRVGTFAATSPAELTAGIRGLDWAPFLRSGTGVSVRAAAHRSKLHHTGRISDATWAALGHADGGPMVFVRIESDVATVSIDACGDALYMRGYRVETGPAPLRPTHAAALVLASGWAPDRPLYDPFCGTGTIPIEAACVAAARLPGHTRTFACERWPAMQAIALPGPTAFGRTVAFGSDVDAAMVEAARANGAAAGVDALVGWSERELRDVEPPQGGPGFIATNPPYGDRLPAMSGERELYFQLGDVLRRRFRGWHLTLLVRRSRQARALRLDLRTLGDWEVGGLPVQVLSGRVW
jgi:putative N6-adenine-specific DNA methylase